MRRRGLPDPLLMVSDGAPGLICALEELRVFAGFPTKFPPRIWSDTAAQ
jgi:hypothetical protein